MRGYSGVGPILRRMKALNRSKSSRSSYAETLRSTILLLSEAMAVRAVMSSEVKDSMRESFADMKS